LGKIKLQLGVFANTEGAGRKDMRYWEPCDKKNGWCFRKWKGGQESNQGEEEKVKRKSWAMGIK